MTAPRPLTDPAAAPQLAAALARGLRAYGKPEPIGLEQWARAHFYLSAESSYVQQAWKPWPFQSAIMAVMSNDDVREIDFKKSARVGYTKMILAFIFYTAHHRRRNQIVWQPTDEDRDSFVKTEIEPALRDIACMRDVMPNVHRRDKGNTLLQKTFIGSVLHTKGGKAAKNYRRLSADCAIFDELSAFDLDVEGEGDPLILGAKRVEGATFPKIICGSTPKQKGLCLIDNRYMQAAARFAYHIPCPSCGELHALTWGGKDAAAGMKWRNDGPATVLHYCPSCGAGYGQAEYLAQAGAGVWVSEDGALRITDEGRFLDAAGQPVPAPEHVAFHIWTAYSPHVKWADIVVEFLAAYAALQTGDDKKMKAFINTTRGECWEGEIERTDVDDIKHRAEPFTLRTMPIGCLLLLAGGDVQGNRLELQVWGYGAGGEMWSIDHRQFFGNPEQAEVWRELDDFLRGIRYPHVAGGEHAIYATAIDSGGHATDAVYAFAHGAAARRVFAVKGYSGHERAIEQGNVRVGYNFAGKIERHGPRLWHVGTGLAKDRFAARLSVTKPGPGFVHLAAANSEEWFEQLAAEDRVPMQTRYGTRMRWVPHRKRNEVIDMTAYCIWLEERLDLWSAHKRVWWQLLEAQVQPAVRDLFAAPPLADDHVPGAGQMVAPPAPAEIPHEENDAPPAEKAAEMTPPRADETAAARLAEFLRHRRQRRAR